MTDILLRYSYIPNRWTTNKAYINFSSINLTEFPFVLCVTHSSSKAIRFKTERSITIAQHNCLRFMMKFRLNRVSDTDANDQRFGHKREEYFKEGCAIRGMKILRRAIKLVFFQTQRENRYHKHQNCQFQKLAGKNHN